ncbi:hypothetical protein GCM10010912_58630 [Paenibacillus albidus]|uniref:Uncharacterized protein n=1 Tax=Paenibacillus albidus TaxID=2041023 RepID=A0A917FT70_9BACL|nr:hypothetical protein [Paenibacillus albidus]GGG06292.1 hypothetical protein GCM10010912_58630 [Paenibacillus albidus]
MSERDPSVTPCSICECEGDEDSGVICEECLEKYENGGMGR